MLLEKVKAVFFQYSLYSQNTYDPNDRINAVRGEALLAVAFDSLFLANIELLEPMGSGLRLSETQENASENKTDALVMYPNPSDGGQVFMEIKSDEVLENSVVEIYNITGQFIVSYQFTGENRIVALNSDNLITGIYFVKLISDNKLVETKKLLINN